MTSRRSTSGASPGGPPRWGTGIRTLQRSFDSGRIPHVNGVDHFAYRTPVHVKARGWNWTEPAATDRGRAWSVMRVLSEVQSVESERPTVWFHCHSPGAGPAGREHAP
ncbi:hypothetical protein GCM10010446_44790 [Streptomyces enissocaesilis]|uniref:Uncharacterized protein n=1 Tax=Streptomyces enissocaesilis TaxID=332589 RepID=A0ABP6K143_9ACTN